MMFQSSPIHEAEELFEKVEISHVQRGILIKLCAVLSKFLPMSKFALCGFAIMAVRDWQVINKKNLIEIESPQEIMRIMQFSLNHMKANIKVILEDRADEDQIDQGISETLNYYHHTYGQRLGS